MLRTPLAQCQLREVDNDHRMNLVIILAVIALTTPFATLLIVGPGETPLTTKPKRPGDIWPATDATTVDMVTQSTREQSCP